jgi:hypothetical protein
LSFFQSPPKSQFVKGSSKTCFWVLKTPSCAMKSEDYVFRLNKRLNNHHNSSSTSNCCLRSFLTIHQSLINNHPLLVHSQSLLILLIPFYPCPGIPRRRQR